MRATKTAAEGRDLFALHEASINSLQQVLGIEPSVGRTRGGKGYVGFSTLRPTDTNAMLRDAKRANREGGEYMARLIEDGLAMREPFEKLLAKEGQDALGLHETDATDWRAEKKGKTPRHIAGVGA